MIGQWPNTPLTLFAIASILAFALSVSGAGAGRLDAALRMVAAASLGWWALDEVVRGVNPWRRCLGSAVMLYGAWSVAGWLSSG